MKGYVKDFTNSLDSNCESVPSRIFRTACMETRLKIKRLFPMPSLFTIANESVHVT